MALETGELSLRCRYHKKKGERFEGDNIFKGFKCLELFHAVYPMVLGLMYDAEFSPDELVIKCPDCTNAVTARLYSEPIRSAARRFLNKIITLLRPLRPMDVLNSAVYVEVISVQGICPAGCKKGDIFEIYHRGAVCPQALYSIFPIVLLSDDDRACQCPSHNKIVFKKAGHG